MPSELIPGYASNSAEIKNMKRSYKKSWRPRYPITAIPKVMIPITAVTTANTIGNIFIPSNSNIGL